MSVAAAAGLATGAARGRSVWTSWAIAAEPMSKGRTKAIFLMLDIVADRSLSGGEQGSL
jgi:hypothetical protein